MRLGISQEELAHRAGFDRTYISGIERGRENLTLLSLNRLATALEVLPSNLVEDIPAEGDGDPRGL
jgi:transcriptional regulator with XRE-family HTH domain